MELEKNVPKKYLNNAHHLLILHGRYICKARNPECYRCVVNDLCMFKNKNFNLKKMQQFDLLGIGNSVVDVLYEVDEEFIKKNNLQKSVMTLIDEEKAEKFYSQLKQGVEVAGGSVANSTVGFALLSGKPAFIGKIKDDNLGKSFSKSLADNKVFYKTEPILEGSGTA